MFCIISSLSHLEYIILTLKVYILNKGLFLKTVTTTLHKACSVSQNLGKPKIQGN